VEQGETFSLWRFKCQVKASAYAVDKSAHQLFHVLLPGEAWKSALPSRSSQNFEYLLFSAASSSITNNLSPLELTAATMLAKHNSSIENNERILCGEIVRSQLL
jgi:hypothetical protein